jgi:antitoxin ParD1/3/4
MAMSTTTLHISLPESLKDFVRERVADRHYSNPSDYIRALIREDQKRREEERLSRDLTLEDWRDLKEEIRKRREEERLEQVRLEGIRSGSREPTPKETTITPHPRG